MFLFLNIGKPQTYKQRIGKLSSKATDHYSERSRNARLHPISYHLSTSAYFYGSDYLGEKATD